MPIYEYRCGDCGHEFEKLQKLDEQRLIDCPECGQAALQKLISAAGFRLKGKGWYETDFKTGQKKNVSDSNSDKPKTAEPVKKNEQSKSAANTKKSNNTTSSDSKSS